MKSSWYAWANDALVDSFLNFRRPFETKCAIKLLKLKHSDKVLEIGCNKGKFLSRLQHLGLKPENSYGIDLNESGIVEARKNVKGHFQVMSASKLRFKNSSFDKVVIMHVLEHVPDYRKCLREIRRVLKPGGIFVLTTPLDIIRPHFFKIAGSVCKSLGAGKRQDSFVGELSYYLQHNPHVNVFRIKQLVKDARKAGLETKELRLCCYLPIIPLGRPRPESITSQLSSYDLLSYSATINFKAA